MALLTSVTPAPQAADAATDDAADLIVEFRARSEIVSQTGLEDAHALTVRSRLGWRSERRRGLQALIEGEAVSVIDDDFSAPLSPDPARPTISDGDSLELNRAQLSWRPSPAFEIIAGRQRVVLGDGRFVGNSGWRQNEQTFDALRINTTVARGLSVTFLHAKNVRRFPGADHPQGVWRGAVNALSAQAETPAGRLSGLYLTSDLEGRPAESLRTWVIAVEGERRVTGQTEAAWRLDYGRQSAFGPNHGDFSVAYARAVVGVRRQDWSVQVGREWLEGDGPHAFQTPLGSNHAFLGWSDVIGATPSYGLTDDLLRVQRAGGRFRLAAEAHSFQDGSGRNAVGREFDISASAPLGERLSIEAKAARFESRRLAFADFSKVWLTLEYRY
ncbi:hypothetical protein Q0812_08840 [Brevundimonas sp. 2R-24]|uniref:Alginate export domain-containing protein n=1 Tax=Peiella sedimenti TaxID=3061083 RepID=A0ABT8SLV0_9CAUL|nr:hypothetical protein [Caulobacteraceae bacterium XZ-24]